MKLYVGNLPFRATEDDVRSWFSQSGIQVDTVNIIRDRMSGDPRGFGFVEINDEVAAKQALDVCHGKEMMGRALVINEARPAPPGGAARGNREARGAGGGHGGGGRERW